MYKEDEELLEELDRIKHFKMICSRQNNIGYAKIKFPYNDKKYSYCVDCSAPWYFLHTPDSFACSIDRFKETGLRFSKKQKRSKKNTKSRRKIVKPDCEYY